MIENPMLAEEEMVWAASECPQLSPGLRTRVIAAAFEAQRRRTTHRRVLAAACLLVSAVGLLVWNRAPSLPRLGLLGGGSPANDVAGPTSPLRARHGIDAADRPGQLIVFQAMDEWSLVEEQFRTREERLMVIHRAF